MILINIFGLGGPGEESVSFFKHILHTSLIFLIGFICVFLILFWLSDYVELPNKEEKWEGFRETVAFFVLNSGVTVIIYLVSLMFRRL